MKRKAVQAGLILTGAAMLVAGAVLGGAGAVLRKAVLICLECMGIG